jgi:3-phenylpropionate/trans-cinnamate dioxygenase ferredoxin reductase component
VVTAVGVRPATGWLDSSGVKLDNGVVVDDRLRASAAGVFAAGDCASFWSGRYGRRLRVEHWDTALHAPEVVAANMLGGDEVYDPVPYFWSEQFGRMVQYVGHHGPADRLIWRGDPAGPRWAACWLARPGGLVAGREGPVAGREGPVAGSGRAVDRLVAVLTVDSPRDLLQGRRVIASGAQVDPARLADPGVPVRDTVLG